MQAVIEPPLGSLAILDLDETEIAMLPPLYRAFCRLNYPSRRLLLVQVRKLQAAVPDLREGDGLEILSAIGCWLNGGGRS